MKPYKRIKKHSLTNLLTDYKIFEDLVFYPHRNGLGGRQAIMDFGNGHRISVVGGGFGIYGDGISTFEIWRSCDDDVKGYLTIDQVTDEMIELQNMDSSVPRSNFGF